MISSSDPTEIRRIARLEVEQVHAMVRAGILREGEPVELIDGVLVYKDRSAAGEDPMTIGKKHNLAVKLLARLDAELAKRGYHMQTQGPVSLPPYDEPEPDGLILSGEPRDYADRLPQAVDTQSVIEVSDASLEYDRTKKLALYAQAGITQYVIVNVRENCIEIYEQPDPVERRYRSLAIKRVGEIVALRLASAERLEIEAGRILP